MGGSAVLLVGWTLPETNRGIVGNGSVPAQGIWRTWWASLRTFRQSLWTPKQESKTTERRSQNATDAPGADDVEKSGGTGDASTSIPIIYGTSGYGFSEIYVGLTYLAGGFGVIAGGFINGRLMDWNYRVVARQAGPPVDKHSGDDMSKFPIEMARSRGSMAILGVSVCVVIAFGWTVKYKIHPAVPLILQFYIGAKCTVLHQAYSALLVNMSPQKPSTVGANDNVIRCALSAADVAVLQPLVDARYGLVLHHDGFVRCRTMHNRGVGVEALGYAVA
ncbi:hypothetical protein PG997_008474 [Apiospora hydei]|uniref:Uncharacterized protein n=1 Tax=Apiospora hydei TaxID=1337664 RepID=A0ABR1WAY3_9PEZI